jgi:hypothetical protein
MKPISIMAIILGLIVLAIGFSFAHGLFEFSISNPHGP